MACDGKQRIVGGVCFLVTFLLGVILFAVSFGTLDPHTVGIKYNNNLVTIDETRVFNNGRYFLGLGLSFIEFPIELQEIQFRKTNALRAWSKEGQLIELDVSFFYRLERDRIVDVYKRYGTEWNARFQQFAIRTIKKVTVEYTAEQFFLERARIGEHMRKAMRWRLGQEWAQLLIFNLREVDIPDNFEQKIIDKVVEAQRHKTALNIKKTAVLHAQIEVIRRTGEAVVALYEAEANAKALVVTEAAVSEGMSTLAKTEAAAYGKLQDTLGLNATSILQFRWSQIMSKLTEKEDRDMTYVVGFNNGVLSVEK